MKPDIKKFKSKISALNSLYKDKDIYLKCKSDEKNSFHREAHDIEKKISETYKQIGVTKNEINAIYKNIETRGNEIIRLRTNLRYQTAKQYDSMIAQLENDMRVNGRNYNKLDEQRILNEIANLKRGKQLLEEFEKIKVKKTELEDELKRKKKLKDDLSKNYMQFKTKKSELYEKIKEIQAIVHKIEAEKADILNSKAEVKKQLNQYFEQRKEEQLKRKQNSNQSSKINMELVNAESISRDCTKLLSYLQNFQLQTTTNDESLLGTSLTTSTISTITNSSTLSVSSDDQQISPRTLSRPTNLDLSLINSLSISSSQTPLQSSKYLTVNDDKMCSVSPSATTPTKHLSLTVDELSTPSTNPGSFYLKKKNEETFENRRSCKKKKHKTIKLTYSLEELTLFEKLSIKEPKTTDGIEECVKILKEKRDYAQEQIKVHKNQAQMIDELNAILDTEEFEDPNLIKTQLDAIELLSPYQEIQNQSSVLYSDTNSEISYFDLNYESDTNISNAACSSSVGAASNLNALLLTPTNTDSEYCDSATIKDTSTNISDDSDATVSENINEKSLATPLMDVLNETFCFETSPVTTPLTPSKDITTNKSITKTNRRLSKTNSLISTNNNNNNNTIDVTNKDTIMQSTITNTDHCPPVIINRQLSDGYGSSNSAQLSANSHTEQNPFFTNTTTDTPTSS